MLTLLRSCAKLEKRLNKFGLIKRAFNSTLNKDKWKEHNPKIDDL